MKREPRANIEDMERFATILFQRTDVTELRAFKDDRRRGYQYDQVGPLVEKAEGLNRDGWNCYLTLNPVGQAYHSSTLNRGFKLKGGEFAANEKMECRQAILIDLDPVRRSKDKEVASTDKEKAAAYDVAIKIREAMDFWPKPILADSGNGFYLLYAVNLVNDDESKAIVEQCLRRIKKKHATDDTSIDLSVASAGQFLRFIGTINCKGESTPERPHRVSKLIEVPDPWVPMLKEQAIEFGGEPELFTWAEDDSSSADALDVEAFAERCGVAIKRRSKYRNGRKWILETCPFCGESDESAVIIQSASGKLGFRCHHNRCSGDENGDQKDWRMFRAKVDPDYEPDEPIKFEMYEDDEERESGPTSPPSEAYQPPVTLDESLFEMPGFLGDFYRYCLRGMRVYQPVFAFGATLSLGSILCNLRWRFNRSYPNLYIALLGKSGSGKGEAIERVKDVLRAADLPLLSLDSELYSEGGLAHELSLNDGCRLWIDDEYGKTIKYRDGDTGAARMRKFLLKQYETVGQSYTLSRVKQRDRLHIPRTFLAYLGATQPDTFRKNVSLSEVEDGYLPRFLVFRGVRFPEDVEDPDYEIPSNILEAASQIQSGFAWNETTDLPCPAPLKDVMKNYRRDLRVELQQLRDGLTETGFARVREHINKLALLRAVSRDVTAPKVSVEDVEWGIMAADNFCRYLLELVRGNVFASRAEEVQQIVLDAIPPGKIITGTELYRRTKQLTKTERKDGVDFLLRARIVRATKVSKGKATELRYERR